jgi:acyl-CoA dehydrogenase
MPSPAYPTLLQEVRRIAKDVAAPAAAAVDRDARFPHETLAALREARVLSAAVPVALGGAGLTLAELSHLCFVLAQGCGASGMVLAMHTIQVGCIARHAAGSAFFEAYLRELSAEQYLLASMTSEVGTFGDTRTSVCAIEPDPADAARFRLDKDATTGSYCAHADAILVTARRDPAAAPSDQVLALIRREDAKVEQVGTWDTLGMRGTCSPGFRLASGAPRSHLLPQPFADISALTMVSYSHVMWAALWSGIAADAHQRAAAFVRGQARKNPGTTPPTALRLAELTVQLQAMRHHWQSVAAEFDALPTPATALAPAPGHPIAAEGAPHALSKIGWSLKFNSLKTAAAERAPEIVHGALQIVGILGYKNDTPFSLGRHYRDSLSAALMISNDRIAAQSANMLLVFKDDQE